MILPKEVWVFTISVIVWLFAIFGYFNEIMPENTLELAWYLQLSYFIGLVLVICLPLAYLALLMDKKESENYRL